MNLKERKLMIDNYITFRLYVPIGIMTLLIVILFFHRNHAHTLENIYEEIIADKKIWNIRFMETYHLIKEIMSGKISFCKIKSNHDKLLTFPINGYDFCIFTEFYTEYFIAFIRRNHKIHCDMRLFTFNP